MSVIVASTAMQPTETVVVTAPFLAGVGGGAAGLFVGLRFVGGAFGGPAGFVLGTVAGWAIAKALHK